MAVDLIGQFLRGKIAQILAKIPSRSIEILIQIVSAENRRRRVSECFDTDDVHAAVTRRQLRSATVAEHGGIFTIGGRIRGRIGGRIRG